MSNLFKYRADIDGLRAIAVLLIVLFHAKVAPVSGGFIGVDVFFVISGFLITVILSKEVEAGTFSFKHFYLRRIKRLAPALIVLLTLVNIPAYLFLFASDFEIYGRNLIHSFIATSNFFLWQNVGGYFSPNTDFFPLLHTWSLAVEEQFYFVWPVSLLLLYKAFKAKNVAVFALVALIPLFVLSIYLANVYPHMAYFLLPARAFELLMGSALALWLHRIPRVPTNLNHLLSLLGVMLIFVPAFIISKQSVFPGVNALWPCLGAALLIISGKDKGNLGLINKLISVPAFVWVGLISYSLYLWHWPIFVFIQYLGIELASVVQLGAIVAAFIFAHLSYKLVEQPFRHAKLPTLGSAMTKLCCPALFCLLRSTA